MTKALIADDHPVFRRGLKQLLLSTSAEWELEEAGTSQEILTRAEQQDYALIFLDISLPGRSGLEVLHDILRAKPQTVVLMLSMYSDEQYAAQALKAGAAGYISKDSETEKLLEAIQIVLRGEAYFRANVLKNLGAQYESGKTGAPHEQLSTRELEVLRMLIRGERLVKIAERLAISKSAVSTYRLRLLEKMNMKSNSDLVQYAVKAGLLD